MSRPKAKLDHPEYEDPFEEVDCEGGFFDVEEEPVEDEYEWVDDRDDGEG